MSGLDHESWLLMDWQLKRQLQHQTLYTSKPVGLVWYRLTHCNRYIMSRMISHSKSLLVAMTYKYATRGVLVIGPRNRPTSEEDSNSSLSICLWYYNHSSAGTSWSDLITLCFLRLQAHCRMLQTRSGHSATGEICESYCRHCISHVCYICSSQKQCCAKHFKWHIGATEEMSLVWRMITGVIENDVMKSKWVASDQTAWHHS